ncbi:MMPL family transporter [Leifsonia bigeumensis]|uniref:MMPL family transporter n=1 Tax=Leifsonella bigeumensis TaxID=433643 RepID=A0ABP7FX82_9MICO
MATLLYRLGRFSFRRPWRVIATWLVLLVAILGGGIALGGQSQESFAIPGTESQQALDRLEAVFPEVAGAGAEAVFVAPDGNDITGPAYEKAIDRMATDIRAIPGINSVTTPFDEYAGKQLSDDGSMAITRIQFDGASTEVTDAMLHELTATASIAEDAGLRVEFGGQVFQETSFGITVTEVFGVVFAGIVLLVTFGSLLAAGMPLLSALIGVGIVIGGITTASAFTTISSSAPLLALMIGLAVGIDYTLFILSRHRNQLAAGEGLEESAAKAVGTAGSAVVFAGVTVIIALLGLLVVGIPFLSVMGIGAAFAVLIAIGVATTLLPAMLGVAGERLRPKPGSRAARRALALAEGGIVPDGDTEASAGAGTTTRRRGGSMGLRWVTAVLRHPILASVGVVGLLGVLAIPALDLQLSLPDGGSEPAASTQRQAYDLVSEGFGAGYNGPLIVAVDITQTTDIVDDLDGIADRLRSLDDVAWVSQGLPDAGLDTAIIQVVPGSAPEAEQTKQLVQAIRDLAPAIEDEYGTAVWVTGTTAVGIDISSRLSAALVPFGLVVVGLSIVLLMMVFRSVLVPVKAALGFLLSVVAAFGVTVAVFQWGWLGDLVQLERAGPILSFMPIILMAVLFGLAMDYEVFLVSGMREEFVHGRRRGDGDARAAIPRGFANGARVVTAAALIMFFVFFAFVPEGSGMIKPIALGLATGIAFDAFLVRMTLGPALMALMGRAAWWMPAWLGRVLPDVDIEGESLRAHITADAWARKQRGMAITAEGLVAGTASSRVGPIGIAVPEGSVLLVNGPAADRRMLAATLAGRLGIVGGRAQVAGHPLPSEVDRVARRVAMIDVGGADRSAGDSAAWADPTWRELVEERLRVTLPWYRSWITGRATAEWMRRVSAVSPIAPDAGLRTVPRLERAIALASVALAESPAVVMLDASEYLPGPEEEQAFLDAVATIARADTTIVVGSTEPLAVAAVAGRAVVRLDLDRDQATASPAGPTASDSTAIDSIASDSTGGSYS